MFKTVSTVRRRAAMNVSLFRTHANSGRTVQMPCACVGTHHDRAHTECQWRCALSPIGRIRLADRPNDTKEMIIVRFLQLNKVNCAVFVLSTIQFNIEHDFDRQLLVGALTHAHRCTRSPARQWQCAAGTTTACAAMRLTQVHVHRM
jgi:hypothetical protein